MYKWKKEKIDALVSEVAEQSERVQNAVDTNESNVQHGANRNFQSLRAKLSSCVSSCINSIETKGVKEEEQSNFLQGPLLYCCHSLIIAFCCLDSLISQSPIGLLKHSSIIKTLRLNRDIRAKLIVEALHLMELYNNKEPVPYWFRPITLGRFIVLLLWYNILFLNFEFYLFLSFIYLLPLVYNT